MSPFQKTIKSILEHLHARDIQQALRLLETVEDQPVSDLSAQLKSVGTKLRDIQARPVNQAVAVTIQDVKDILEPLLLTGAKVPDPVKWRDTLRAIQQRVEENTVPAYRGIQALFDDARLYSTSTDVLDDLGEAAQQVTFAKALARDPSLALRPDGDRWVKARPFVQATIAALLRRARTASADPKTLQEWKQYIRSLAGPTLLSKALAANQVTFVRLLEADGLTPTEIATVFQTFAVRLVEDGQAVPSRVEGSYVDYGALAYPTNLDVATN